MARDEWEDDVLDYARLTGSGPMAARLTERNYSTVKYHQRRDPEFRERMQTALAAGKARKRSLPWVLALALGAFAGPLAAIESPPFALGQTGLSLTVRLRQWTEATGLWADVSPHSVTVTEEGSGEYSLADLPAATGSNRYAATVAITSDATRGLFTYQYGAQPGTRLVWREEIALPSQPLIFRRGDSYGSLALTITRGLPEGACDATATMDAANSRTGAMLFSDRAATITNCEEDVTTGTFGATITADLTAGDLDEAGQFLATATLCYEVDSCQTLPGANSLRFEVVRRLGD